MQGMRQPQAGASQDGANHGPNGAGDFTATLASFMAGGIEAAMPDLAGAGARPGQPPDDALLSPEPTAGCHVSAAPPSVAGSVPGSSGTPFQDFHQPAQDAPITAMLTSMLLNWEWLFSVNFRILAQSRQQVHF